MTDRQILEEVYRRLKESDDPHGWKTNPIKDGITSFIEQEWQKRDEAAEAADEVMEAATEIFGENTTFSKHWYNKQ